MSNLNTTAKLVATILSIAFIISACAPAGQTPVSNAEPAKPSADLSGVKNYLLDHTKALQATSLQIQKQSDQYYALAKDANFDYAALWLDKQAEVKTVLLETRRLYIQSNPQYEQMEGIVAGTPSLSKYDVILDAGVSGAEGGEDIVPFDLTLPDGRVLPKPGHLFWVLESSLWGTNPDFIVPNLQADLDGNGEMDLGDSLPDANVLKGAADSFVSYVADLNQAAETWQPTEEEAFGTLVGNIPTFSDFIESWKNSRFVMGDQATVNEFVATSRLSDLTDNVQSWQTIYSGLSPLVKTTDADANAQVHRSLKDLHEYVANLYAQEQSGKRFTPEEADLLSAEGQDRATAIAGQIAQIAAKLNISIQEQ
jgi:hypothetical protein